MRVETCGLVPWNSGHTSAGLNNIPSNKLIVNGVCISENLPDAIGSDNLIQIDICGECFTRGCTDDGYVQVFEIDGIVIWKKPYQKGYEISSASGLNAGTIYWNSAMYASFLTRLGWTDDHKSIGLPIDQVIDLWRINAVKTIFPLASSRVIGFERMEEEIMGFYSTDWTAEQSKEIYLSAKERLLTAESSNLSIIELSETAVKIVAMLDTNPYQEWNCIYYENGVELFPIGDNLAVRLGE
ncbi:hypothetical protein [Paenibacillus sp. LHD-38]|uniref:hypothetical protein n=1 Tax=Paenibacillus sp. LHD-38 TaxID=3072143 RepID=UPI00280D836B|nr:hypothetical protein [Paenibacillus sp. LHD-38]MDQ8736593.1 hypothetical protein [Paenibacillus sp. LHD-38]